MSKIVSAQTAGTWDGPNGTMHRIEVLLDDGTSGEVMAMTPDRWKAGDEVEVKSKKETQYGVKLKLDKPGYGYQSGYPSPSGGAGSKDARVGAQWAINAALTNLGPGSTEADIEKEARILIAVRDRLSK